MLSMNRDKSKIRKVIALFLFLTLGVLATLIVFNLDTIRGEYKTEIEDTVIKVPSLSVKGKMNMVVSPPLYIFYTFHDKDYVENFFTTQVFSEMEKIQYGYENTEMGITIEDFKIFDTDEVFGMIPITKYSFSYRTAR